MEMGYPVRLVHPVFSWKKGVLSSVRDVGAWRGGRGEGGQGKNAGFQTEMGSVTLVKSLNLSNLSFLICRMGWREH